MQGLDVGLAVVASVGERAPRLDAVSPSGFIECRREQPIIGALVGHRDADDMGALGRRRDLHVVGRSITAIAHLHHPSLWITGRSSGRLVVARLLAPKYPAQPIMTGLRAIAALGVLAVPLNHVILTRLLRMVETVGRGRFERLGALDFCGLAVRKVWPSRPEPHGLCDHQARAGAAPHPCSRWTPSPPRRQPADGGVAAQYGGFAAVPRPDYWFPSPEGRPRQRLSVHDPGRTSSR